MDIYDEITRDLPTRLKSLQNSLEDTLSSKAIQDLALKASIEKAQNYKQSQEMSKLSDMLQNVQSIPGEALSRIPIEPDLKKRQQILDTHGEAMRAKQNAGGTFTNEDMVPYMQAGYQSPQAIGGNENVSTQFIRQAMEQGIDPKLAEAYLAERQPVREAEPSWADKQTHEQKQWEQRQEYQAQRKKEEEKHKEYKASVQAYNNDVAELQKEFRKEVNKMSDADEINKLHEQYQIEINNVANKYQDRLKFNPVQGNQPETLEPVKKEEGKTWSIGGMKFRINPDTGVPQFWKEG